MAVIAGGKTKPGKKPKPQPLPPLLQEQEETAAPAAASAAAPSASTEGEEEQPPPPPPSAPSSASAAVPTDDTVAGDGDGKEGQEEGDAVLGEMEEGRLVAAGASGPGNKKRKGGPDVEEEAVAPAGDGGDGGDDGAGYAPSSSSSLEGAEAVAAPGPSSAAAAVVGAEEEEGKGEATGGGAGGGSDANKRPRTRGGFETEGMDVDAAAGGARAGDFVLRPPVPAPVAAAERGSGGVGEEEGKEEAVVLADMV